MSINSRAKSYGTIWADWQIGEMLGSGSGGKTMVYKLTRHNHGFDENDVLKVVNIIEENLGLDEMSQSYREEYQRREAESIKNAEKEVNLMHMLQNSRNIVTYQDFKFCTTREEHFTAVDLLIRMHMYEDLSSIMKKDVMEESEIINVGIDICEALEGCRKCEIIHRDIKPDNIFYNKSRYLLGDFGISRILERGNLAQTHKGTQTYAAPEQFNNVAILDEGYDYRVDIYSLGITLYQLANKGHLPFVNEYSSMRNAILERITGKPIPPIKNINDELNNIILKACQYNPDDRYQSATDMLEDLQELKKKLRRMNITTETALDVNIESYSTEPAINRNIEYSTEPALNKGTEYSTEPAINRNIEYSTEPAINKGTEYSTEPAINRETEYSTEPALNKGTEYSTEPALNTEPECLKSSVVKYNEEPKNLEPVAIFNYENSGQKASASNSKAADEDVDYKQKALKELYAGNKEEAFNSFKKLNELGIDYDIYFEISKIYSSDGDIEAAVEDAIFWYEKCIELSRDSWEISLAEYKLGEIYSKGIGVKKNHKIAEKYYRDSMSKGNPYAKKKFVAGKYIKK